MRILKTYVIAEHLKPFLLGLSVFAFILFMGNMGELVRIVMRQKGEAMVVMKLFLYLIPFIISYSLPMAVLLSILLAFGKLNSDNEIIAIKASGLNPLHLITPVILFSLLLSLLCVKLNDSVLPKATYAGRKLIASLGVRKPSIFLQQRTLIEDFSNYVIYIRKVKGNYLYGVQIAKLKEEGLPTSIAATKGEILPSSHEGIITLKLMHGTIDEAKLDEPYRCDRSSFNEYYLELKLPPQETSVSKRPKDMTIRELKEKIAEFQQKRIDISPLLTEINRKLSLAFASLSFALIASPLALRVRKGGKSTGFGLSLFLIIIYYLLFTAGQALGEKGILPEVSVWAPNIILGAVGSFLLWRTK